MFVLFKLTFFVYDATMQEQILDQLSASMQRKTNNLPERLRLFTTEYGQLPQTVIVTGLRGIGKSTFLLYHARNSGKRIMYLSADSPLISSEPLYSVVSFIFSQGYEGVIVDEVHYAKDWAVHLKALHDDYPDRIIWASDSSSLILRQGNADLSRRFVKINMPLMSFREFLFLESGKVYEKYTFGNPDIPLKPDADLLNFFHKYRKYGTRPFYQEGDYSDRLLALLDKTLNSDVPFFVPMITADNLRLMSSVIGTLAYAPVPRLQVRSLCADWNISADKLYQLLNVMESVGILTIVRYENDTKANTAGAKLLIADPCLYTVLSGNRGSEREALVVSMLKQSGYEVTASKDETSGDYVIKKQFTEKKYRIEIGGRNKNIKQSDYVIRDDTDYPSEHSIPLWLICML